VLSACKEQRVATNVIPKIESIDTLSIPQPIASEQLADYDTLAWTELSEQQGFVLDLRYATEDNFTKIQIYDCDRCFLRPAIADKLLEINRAVGKQRNCAIKLFDCYRPLPAQQKLWDIVPNATYVANPAKGSMHNRGAAVDLTLVDLKTGVALDMGTDFDHFGPEARPAYSKLPNRILQNRQYLKSLMEAHGFRGIKSEWWHYSLSGTGAPLSSWEWACD